MTNFTWGVATSSYQIEGAHDVGGRLPSIWDTFSKTPGKIADGSNGDTACDHYHRIDEDVALMAELGVTAYRFSIAWPRVMHIDGTINREGIDFYSRLVTALDSAGIEPYATLYHWDLPQHFEDNGGWTNRATAYAFADYTRATVETLGNRVKAWATLNEPWCSAYLGYANGVHAPGRANVGAAFSSAHHLNLAHGLSINVMREVGVENLGVVLNLAPVRIVAGGPAVSDQAEAEDVWRNLIWLDPIFDGVYSDAVRGVADRAGAALPVVDGDLDLISTPLDWLGINYYHDSLIPKLPEGPRTDMGWPITPEGMYDVIAMASQRTDVPLYITENGGAFASQESLNDQDRITYLSDHIAHMRRAIDDGMDVRGYFEWSLLDNFEWAEGYAKRFGLVKVDFDTLERTKRASFDWYRDLINP